MKLLPADEKALQEALRGVREAAEACAQQPDTDAVEQALDAVWHAVRRARDINRDAAEWTRRAALKTLETVA